MYTLHNSSCKNGVKIASLFRIKRLFITLNTMKEEILQELSAQRLITESQTEQIRLYEKQKLFSIHWELKTILYLGVLLLNVGLGLLIYLNIDSIGHQAIIAAIGTVSAGSFWYANRYRAPFSFQETKSISPFADYALLLGCFTFLILEGYLQYQYKFFGEKYGLVTFIPMVLFFLLAYSFDHLGVLSLAITALASWLGIAVTPSELFRNNDFSSGKLIYTGIILGIILGAAAWFLAKKDIKKHFSFTYLNFGAHILFVACIAGLMALEKEIFFSILLLMVTAFFVLYAKKEKSFYFLIISVMYAYWGISYLIFQVNVFQSVFIFYYFIFSCAGVLYFLAKYKKVLNIQ